jgi:uncharacterized membrane protein YgcG
MAGQFHRIFSFLLVVGFLMGNMAHWLTIPASAQDSEDYSDQISVSIRDQGDSLEISYVFDQVFQGEANRGIYLALPKNQDGFWTNYELLGVQRSTRFEPAQNQAEETLQRQRMTVFQDEPYDQIKEWSEFRVRVGHPNRILENGWYRYQITLKTNKSNANAHFFTFLRDWGDPIRRLSITYNGQNFCSNDCPVDQFQHQLTLNQDKPRLPAYQSMLNETGPYLIGLVIIYTLIFLLWYNLARDPSSGFVVNKPEFEPPNDLTPWQAQYLISEGKLSLKNTLFSYILWLNNNQYISLQTHKTAVEGKQSDQGKVQIKILKPLPNQSLPPSFNIAVELIEKKGLQEGLLASKLNESSDEGPANNTVYDSLKRYYGLKPVYSSFGWAFLVTGGALLVVFLGFSFLRESVLLGNSWGLLFNLVIIFSFPGLWWLIRHWGKLTREGYELRAYALRYRYYLEKVEQYKLDFSNNPAEGVQYYLKSVPYAAAFGILPKFNKYFSELIPNQTDSQGINAFYAGWSAAHFYTPPTSDSSGFGGGGGGFNGGGRSW